MPHRLAIQKLKSDIVAMGEMSEYALMTAIMSLLDRDTDLACFVLDYDREIDEMELKIDRACSDLLHTNNLTHDEVGFVMAASKINNDIERIGDLACEICQHVLFLVRERSVLAQVVDFNTLVEQAGEMIRESINALMESDTRLAWKIIDERLCVDEEMLLVFRELMDMMRTDQRTVERCCHILFIVKSLRRVADLAANIAEEVVLVSEGVVIRHHIREFHPVDPLPSGEEEQIESGVMAQRRSREELKREDSKTRVISVKDVAAEAADGRSKADKAREKLLKMRAKKAQRA